MGALDMTNGHQQRSAPAQSKDPFVALISAIVRPERFRSASRGDFFMIVIAGVALFASVVGLLAGVVDLIRR